MPVPTATMPHACDQCEVPMPVLLVWEPGDPSVGIWPGWLPPDEWVTCTYCGTRQHEDNLMASVVLFALTHPTPTTE